jgi:hypothetical protein
MLMLAEATRGDLAIAEVLGEKLIKSPDAVSAGIAHSYLAGSAYDRGDGAKAARHYLQSLRVQLMATLHPATSSSAATSG